MRAIFVGLVAISFTLTAVGCGGDPCADYEKKLCADEKSKESCEAFKAELSKAKSAGTAGDLKKTCEANLANWDKRGEGAAPDKDKQAKADAAKAKCKADGGEYKTYKVGQEEHMGCVCSDGRPQFEPEMENGAAKTVDGKVVYKRKECPPKTTGGAGGGNTGAQGSGGTGGDPGDAGKKGDKGAEGDTGKKDDKGAEGDAKGAEGDTKGEKGAEGDTKGEKGAEGDAKGDAKGGDAKGEKGAEGDAKGDAKGGEKAADDKGAKKK